MSFLREFEFASMIIKAFTSNNLETTNLTTTFAVHLDAVGWWQIRQNCASTRCPKRVLVPMPQSLRVTLCV